MRVTQVSVTGVAASAWLPLDASSVGSLDGVYLDIGAGATVSIQFTPDDVFDATVVPVAYANSGLAGLTADTAAALPFAARAVRMNQTIGATTSVLKVVSRGIT